MKKDESGCWLWTASKSKKGYGALRVKGKNKIASRLSWEIHNGPIPEGLQVLHDCDNSKCVNPNHLFLGTNEDNHKDKLRKGRQAKGERSGPRLHPERMRRGDNHPCRQHPERMAHGENHVCAKLTDNEVKDIRRRCVNGEYQDKVAADYGLNQSTVSNIVRRKTWKHLSD